ncbi:MAG: hypothetical protein ACW99A_03870 [Candidatus Kariarchaeaceae archaeon]
MKTERDEELRKKGWERRTILDNIRLAEITELYESLDFEVLLEPAQPKDFGEKCSNCYLADCDKFSILYLRKKID